MALNAAQQWWIRAGGNALNGGGYDSTVASAGTNYCDQDAPQLSLTDVVTAGSTTVTSVTGGFTAAMIGNIIRIAGDGYYVITAVASSNSITVDRNTGTSAASNARVGGAFASIDQFSTGGSVSAPALTSPLAAGHTINVRGAGTDTPGSADYTHTGYSTFVSGSYAAGPIRLVGYNGRPRIDVNGLTWYLVDGWFFDGLMIKATGTNDFGNTGVITGAGPITIGIQCHDVRFDQAGFDVYLLSSVPSLSKCSFINSGSSSAGTKAVFYSMPTDVYIVGCTFNGHRGFLGTLPNFGAQIFFNLFLNFKKTGTGVIVTPGTIATYLSPIWGNTFDGNAGDDIQVGAAQDLMLLSIKNNIFTNHAGYGVNGPSGLALNTRCLDTRLDYNAADASGSGVYHNLPAGPNDVTLTASPYVGGGDYDLNATAGGGAACKAAGTPSTLPS